MTHIEHIGDATLILGDCMDAMRDMPDKAFDLAIVDPPYGIGVNMENLGRRAGEIKKYTSKEWDNKTPDLQYFSELSRASKNQIIWGGNCFPLPPKYGWIVWNKDISGDVPFSQAELAWTSFNQAVSVFNLRVQTIDEPRIHPTQKPVALYKWLLSKYAKPGETILDTHGGSGSSVVACLDMGYSITWIEKDEDYFNAALKRIADAYAQPRLFDDKELVAQQKELSLEDDV